MSEIIFDSNTTKKTLQDNSKTDGFLESKGISNMPPASAGGIFFYIHIFACFFEIYA